MEVMAICMGKMAGPRKDLSLEARTKRWVSMPMDLRMGKFRKIFCPKLSKNFHQRGSIELLKLTHITTPVYGKYGMPLKKFPEFKYNYYKLDHKRDPKHVDYSVDEFDMQWLTFMNKEQYRKGKTMFSVAILELWFDRLEKTCNWKPKEHQKLRDEDGKEVDDVCNVCLDPETTNCNQIVYCDRCNLTVHQDCYGIPFIPDGCLECRRCAFSPARLVHCVLCPSTVGAFKQMDNKQWVHVLCVIWVDETHFGNTIFMENVQNVEKAINDRKALSCQLCKNRKHARVGACIQCSESKCTASFHVTCARNAGLTMRIVENDNGQVSRFAWCTRHTPEQTETDDEQQMWRRRNEQRENMRRVPMISMPTIEKATVAAIQLEQPFEDWCHLVGFWYQRRQSRLGAPLLKNYLQLVDDESPETTPNRPVSRRKSIVRPALPRPPPRPSIKDKSKHKKALEKVAACEKSLAGAAQQFDMILLREEKKRDLFNMSVQMFIRGFKPVQMAISSVLDELKHIDTGNVFADPVEIHGYREIIKQPICLKDMTEKLKNGEYGTVTALADDIHLMLQNCAQFNKGNRIYIHYGNTYKRNSSKILEKAKKEELERQNLKKDEQFMTSLLNGVMSEYTGCSTSSEGAPGPSRTSSRDSGSRRRRIPEPEIKMEIEDVPAPEPSKGKRGKKRAIILEDSDDDVKDSGAGKETKDAFRHRPRISNDARIALSQPDTPIHPRKRTQQAPPPLEPTETLKRKETSSALRQTTLHSFFGAGPKMPQIPKFETVESREKGARLLFDIPSTSSSNPFQPSSSSRPSTRSTTTSTTVTPTVTRRTAFRMSSAALQSPLPVPKKVGAAALLDSDDDEDAEIQIQPAPPQLSPEQLKAEKLRSAENEATSKFAHNQLVIVDGRAAKVIASELAHLSEMHGEQRHSMMKKRREVLSEIPQSSLIYVEFFQKLNNMDNFQWVTPDKVELLDVNNCQRTPKIPGLKAAKEWHQKVINGEVV